MMVFTFLGLAVSAIVGCVAVAFVIAALFLGFERIFQK